MGMTRRPLTAAVCVARSWGLNRSGQLGIGDTEDRGATENSMGVSLPVVNPGLRLATPSPVDVSGGEDGDGGDDGGDGLSTVRDAGYRACALGVDTLQCRSTGSLSHPPLA